MPITRKFYFRLAQIFNPLALFYLLLTAMILNLYKQYTGLSEFISCLTKINDGYD